MKSNIAADKGTAFEYKVCNLFQNQGFLTRRAVPLQYGSGKQSATDIDIFCIYFSLPFRNTRIICDAKNKARPNPHERIFWTKGLGEFVGANEIYIALPSASWEIIKFANRGKVRVITSEMIEQSLKNSYKYGQADETFYVEYFNKIEKVVKADKKADEVINKVRKLYLKENPYSTLNDVLAILEKEVLKQFNTADILTEDALKFWKYICCELTVLFSIQLLLICNDVLGLPKHAREKQIIEKLSYGEMDPVKVKDIVNSIEAYANEIVRSKIPQSYIPDRNIIKFGSITAPSYAYDVVGLIERAFNNPEIYVTLPQLLDFLLFEQGLKGKEFSDLPYREAFKYNFPDEKLKAAKNIFVFLRDKVGINWSTVWTTENKLSSKENVQERGNQPTLFNTDR